MGEVAETRSAWRPDHDMSVTDAQLAGWMASGRILLLRLRLPYRLERTLTTAEEEMGNHGRWSERRSYVLSLRRPILSTSERLFL